MHVLEALIEARKLISNKNSWGQGAYARTIEGWPCSPLAVEAARFCSMGALRKTLLITPCIAFGPPEVDDSQYEIYLSATNELCLTLNECPVIDYNDSSSHEQVLELFDTTIKRLQNANKS